MEEIEVFLGEAPLHVHTFRRVGERRLCRLDIFGTETEQHHISLDGKENAGNSVGHNRIDIPLDRSENQRAGNRAVDQEIDIPFLSLAFGELLKQLFFAFVNPGGALEGESFVGKANDNRRRLHRELFQPIRRHLHILFHSGRHLEELGINQSVDEFLRLLDIRYSVESAVRPCRKSVQGARAHRRYNKNR